MWARKEASGGNGPKGPSRIQGYLWRERRMHLPLGTRKKGRGRRMILADSDWENRDTARIQIQGGNRCYFILTAQTPMMFPVRGFPLCAGSWGKGEIASLHLTLCLLSLEARVSPQTHAQSSRWSFNAVNVTQKWRGVTLITYCCIANHLKTQWLETANSCSPSFCWSGIHLGGSGLRFLMRFQSIWLGLQTPKGEDPLGGWLTHTRDY